MRGDVERRWMVVYTVIERLVRIMERRRERSRGSMVCVERYGKLRFGSDGL